jgi:hypothetical protein
MHKRGASIAGYEWSDLDYNYEARKYPLYFKFEGRTVTFLTVSNDETITRQEAFEFCRKVHDGSIRWINIDLSHLQQEKTGLASPKRRK